MDSMDNSSKGYIKVRVMDAGADPAILKGRGPTCSSCGSKKLVKLEASLLASYIKISQLSHNSYFNNTEAHALYNIQG